MIRQPPVSPLFPDRRLSGSAGGAEDPWRAGGLRVFPVPRSGLGFPVLRTPPNRHRAVPFTPEQFHFAFANTLSREDSDKVYERYHIPAPGGFIWGGVLEIGRAHV